MTAQLPHDRHSHGLSETPRAEDRGVVPAVHQHPAPGQRAAHGHGGHRWMMIACCIPMLLVVAALVISGVVGAGALVFAVACLAMMWLMMRAMPGDHH